MGAWSSEETGVDTTGLSKSLFLCFLLPTDSFRYRQGKPPGKGRLEHRP